MNIYFAINCKHFPWVIQLKIPLSFEFLKLSTQVYLDHFKQFDFKMNIYFAINCKLFPWVIQLKQPISFWVPQTLHSSLSGSFQQIQFIETLFAIHQRKFTIYIVFRLLFLTATTFSVKWLNIKSYFRFLIFIVQIQNSQIKFTIYIVVHILFVTATTLSVK